MDQAGCCLSYLLVAAAGERQRQQRQGASGQAAATHVQQAVCCLGDLPAPLLERVLGLAAYPLSAWLDDTP